MMTTPQRILLAHADAHTRRMLTMLLVEAGLSVQSVEPELKAVAGLAGEPFALALIGQLTLDEDAFALCPILRESNPDLPIVMLLPELNLPLVVQGIRHGLTDVLPLRTDPNPVVRRILGLLGLESDGEPTTAELAEVEATLAQLDPSAEAPALDQETMEQRERLWKGLRELHLEREIIAAAQAGMDEKARLLRADREQLLQEREAFAVEIADFQAEGRELDQEWRKLDEQQKALQAERQNLSNVEWDLRNREQTIAETIPPMPAMKITGTPRELETEWDQLERARTAFEAERAVFRDERMVLVDLDRQIHQREEQLRDLAEQVADLDRKRRGLPPPPPKALAKPTLASGAVGPTSRRKGLLKGLLGKRS